MTTKVVYEYVLNDVDEFDDIQDVWHFDTYREALHHMGTYEPTHGRYSLELSYNLYDDAAGLLDRQWVEIVDGKFVDVSFDNGKAIPKKFFKELERSI